MKFRVWPETLKQITISTIPVRLIHLHAVLENTQLPCYCNLGEGLEDYFFSPLKLLFQKGSAEEQS